MACKEGQFHVVELMVNNQSRIFSIKLNTQHVNGMTHFDFFANCNRILIPPFFSPITIEY